MHHRASIAVILIALAELGCATDKSEDLFPSSAGGSASSSGKADSPNAAASCKDRCGQASEDESCWCDPGCTVIGDCCLDFPSQCSGTEPATGGAGGSGSGGSGATSGAGGSGASGGTPASGGTGGAGSGGLGGGANGPSSCAGYCGGPSADGSCYCDQECPSYGDCCADVALCGGAGGGGGGVGGASNQGCAPVLCNTEQPGSQGGMECYCDALCTSYGDCCANKTQICG